MASYAIQLRRGTAVEHGSFTGLAGEITVNTTRNSIHVHDGSTAGGTELATKASVDGLTVNSISDVTITTPSSGQVLQYNGSAWVNATDEDNLSNNDTDDLAEGSTNQYYTDARARGAISVTGSGSYNSSTGVITVTGGVTSVNSLTGAVTIDTDDVAEGSTNQYYTDARSRSAISVTGSGSYNSATGVITVTGGVTSVNSLTGAVTIDTDDVAEGSTNQYYTDARARGAVSAGGDLSYNSGTGVFSFTERTDAEVRGLVSAGGDLSYNSTTGVFSFTERTDAEVRGLVSVTDAGGDGSLAYNSSTGVFTYTGPSAAEVRAHFTGGTGVTITSGSIAIGQAVGTGDNVTFNNLTINGDLTVSGTTTTVNTETINLADNIILLNSNEAGTPSQNGGIEIERGLSANKTFVWDETADKWTVGAETMVAGTFEGNLTGAVTGNASTATKWATGRTITLTGDVTGVSGSFDGSGNLSFATTIAANSVALGTDTTGNYVATIADAGNSAITVTNSGSESAAVTLDINAERIQDIVGAMVTGNSESGITVTYQDADGTLDFDVNDPTITLTGDVTGSATMTNLGSVTITTTVAANSVALGTDTTGNYVQQGATSGNGISGSVNSEGGTFTVTSNATSANTASTIVFRDGSGNFSAGTITATATQAQYADLAERYEADAQYDAGTVVVFGGDKEITMANGEYDHRVAGVISSAPAYMMNSEAGDDTTHPYVALTGRVPCKVTGTINKGDILTTSAMAGHAMAGEAKAGHMIGKALENFDGESGVIEVLVNLM